MDYNQNQVYYSKVHSLAKGPVVLIGYSAATTPLQLHDDRMMMAIT